jgi:hypothetical protein
MNYLYDGENLTKELDKVDYDAPTIDKWFSDKNIKVEKIREKGKLFFVTDKVLSTSQMTSLKNLLTKYDIKRSKANK